MNRVAILGVIAVVAAIIIGAVAYFQWQANQPSPKPVAASAPPPAAAPALKPAPAPTPTQPPAAAAVAPSFDVVRVSPNGDAVMAGRADPGAEVTVLDGDKPFATVTADPRGEWVLTPDKPLTPGNHELGLSAKSPGDGSVRKSEGVVVVAVPEPNKNLAGEPSPGGSQSLAVVVPRQGEGPVKALQVPGNAAASGRALFIDTIQYDGAGHLSVGGRAPTTGRVLLYLDNKPEGDTRADQKGYWSVKPPDAVAPGHYTLRADLVGQDGKVAARVTLQFRRAEVPAELAGSQFLVVQSGDSLWRIARRTLGQGPMFTEIYQANRSDIADPNLIYPGQVVTLPPG
ncbi:MAG TPA: LysM peptidoglycan-binding domain-containing protein [Stellaceae bacterium]|nr:LysM peptidoglycan-binding domain-containing protein [Stellaceae bacterium]